VGEYISPVAGPHGWPSYDFEEREYADERWIMDGRVSQGSAGPPGKGERKQGSGLLRRPVKTSTTETGTHCLTCEDCVSHVLGGKGSNESGNAAEAGGESFFSTHGILCCCNNGGG
jgi:hypothetical protein